MKNETKKQIETMNELMNYSHSFLKTEYCEKFFSPFGLTSKDYEEKMFCEGGKGLTGNNGEEFLIGVSSFTIPSAIMRKLKIKNPQSFLGRGTEFRSNVTLIITHLKNQK